MRVAILGATGYAGLTLLKLAARHPEMEVVAAASAHAAGTPLTDFLVSDRGLPERLVQPQAVLTMRPAMDLLFNAQGGSAGAREFSQVIAQGTRVIDLGPSFRFSDLAVYQTYYGEHPAPDLLPGSFTGFADDASLYYPPDRSILGNPGCYPTAFAVAVQPLARRLGPLSGLMVDGKSGVTGAGRNPQVSLLFGEMAENTAAYSAPGRHRHTAEMEAIAGATVVFQPHLVPLAQGLLLTIYIPGRAETEEEVLAIWSEAYAHNPFILIRRHDKPATGRVRATNYAELGVSRDPRSGTLVVYCAIDNLVKGAGGQAMQHANRWWGWPEDWGLSEISTH